MTASVITQEEIDEALHNSDVSDEPDKDSTDLFVPASTYLSSRLEEIRELVNDSNWKETVKGKLFAVHFDKPQKFYIGTLCDISRDEINNKVTELSFEFLDFHGGTRFVKKPKKSLEVLPASNVFNGPIVGNAVEGNATEFTQDICQEIRKVWEEFGKKLHL